ncbi:MAG: ABC transporter permease [Anaerolineae bacterium]|nr:ABC transporter permease [Anaerolineae bacterium]
MQDIHHLPQQGFRHMVNNVVFDVPQRLRRIRRLDLWLVPVVLAVFLGLWEVVIWAGDYPKFILPSVTDVAASFSRTVQDGTLWRHTTATLVEVFGGLALGLTVALVLGYTLAKNEVIERLVSPYLVASQSIPTVAIAPLLIIWFGAGQLSKILIAALIVFFPALVNTIVGIRAVDHDLRDLMRALKADRWQTFWLLEVPAAMPVLLAGLKVSVTLSVIGAVIGEFMGADQGLGFLINQARGLFNTPLVFVAIISLVMITVSLYGGVTLLERWLLRWQRDGRG